MDLLDDLLREKNLFNIAQVVHQFKRNTPAGLLLLAARSNGLNSTGIGNVLHAG